VNRTPRRHKLTDPALIFIMNKLKEQKSEKGLEADCREHGILVPRRAELIGKREIPFSYLCSGDARRVSQETGIQIDSDRVAE